MLSARRGITRYRLEESDGTMAQPDCRRHRSSAPISGRPGELPVWIDDELVRHARVEGLVAFRRLLEVDHLDIDDLGDRQFVPADRLHELPVIFQDRRLACVENV